MLRPSARQARMCSAIAGVTFGRRPPVRPLARATASPALVRSEIRARSNSAEAPMDLADQAPGWSRRINRLGEAPEADAAGLEILEQSEQMRERARQAVELPDHKRVAGL
jgi:hypothetical protein